MSEEKIEIEPVTKKLYWNPKLRDEWEPRISKIRSLYAEAEKQTFLDGMRRVYVYHVNSGRFDASYKFLRENDLVFYPTNKSGAYSGFSHKHMPVEAGKPYTLYGAAVRRDDKEAGELFEKYSKSNPVNHVEIGRLLGYPGCCLDFFNETWNKTSIDTIYESATNTKDAVIEDNTVTVECHPYCNNMLRYFSARITPHLPCSMTCEDTIKWGKQWIEVMNKIDAEATEWVVELLSMPLTWNCYRGVAIIDTPIFRGVTNSDSAPEKKIVVNKGWKQDES